MDFADSLRISREETESFKIVTEFAGTSQDQQYPRDAKIYNVENYILFRVFDSIKGPEHFPRPKVSRLYYYNLEKSGFLPSEEFRNKS